MIGCIIQARTGSKRLPKKILKKIDGEKTMLEFVLKQLQFSKKIEKIIVATTQLKQDDVIEELLKIKKFPVFRGESIDVLDRYYRCAKKFKLDIIVRVGSDCPFIEPFILDKMVREFSKNNYDYMSNHEPRTFPYGMDVEIFTFKALEKAWQDASLPSEREHVSPYIYNKPEKFSCKNFENTKDYSDIRIVVDRKKDLELIKKITSKIKSSPIKLEDIIELKNKNPELFLINSEYVADEGYKKSLLEDFKK